MAYIVTRLCRDCVDTSCVGVCPVDCIYRPAAGAGWPNQLLIHPDECIDCGACEPECPWGAIFEEGATPGNFAEDVALNYALVEHTADFEVATRETRSSPSPEQIQSNKEKWGLPA